MTLYRKFKQLPIHHAAIGLEQREGSPYYCTPKGATILGWAGVDGIHYCTIPEFGEMVFAVSPMNLGDCVHPIARNFGDLLRLLLTCGDMAALEQCYAWDEEQFRAFLQDCPVTPEQQAVLDTIRREFGLEPMENPFAYVKQLQGEFDLSRIPYSREYYDLDSNPAAPQPPREWKVTYDGGFWGQDGRAGREIPVGKRFPWGGEIWHVPAVYACGKGLVVDFCMEVDPEQVRLFLEKWAPKVVETNDSRAQQEQLHREHPLIVDFRTTAVVNGKKLTSHRGSGVTWLPASCAPEENPEGAQVLEHYGLDKSRAWAIFRRAYPWATKRRPEIRSLTLSLERCPEDLPGISFRVSMAGEEISFVHPLTGCRHTLAVLELEPTQMPSFPDGGWECPTHSLVLRYALTPDIPGGEFRIQDCAEGDSPRPAPFPQRADTPDGAPCIGIIGGADGPTAIFLGGRACEPHTAYASPRFEPVEDVQWQMVFRHKKAEPITIPIIE